MHDDEEVIEQARGLWRKYVVITKEMLKTMEPGSVLIFDSKANESL